MGVDVERFIRENEWLFRVELSREDIEALAEAFSGVSNPVDVAFLVRSRGCLTCGPAMEIARALEEAVGIAGKSGVVRIEILSLEEEQGRELSRRLGILRTPATVILGGSIRYIGTPSGEEFKAIVETIARVGEGNPALDPGTLDRVRRFRGRARIEVLVTPMCPYCPYAVVTANMLAYASRLYGNGGLVAETVELYENPDVAERYGVATVPSIAVNGRLAFIGLPSDTVLMEIVERYSQQEVY